MNIVVLRRRLFYIGAIVLLLIPLYFLGSPSIRNLDGSVKAAGGTLAQVRTAYDLGQGDLGEIDPASESMRLATLGLRGVAATILWQKAEYYKKEQYWDRLSATLNQIAILQPHFVKVWEFQSHNLSYNVSAEFDDYRQRYQWVKRGMDYLVKGSKFNKKRTEMPYELGWFFGNKFGVADERKQFRELYREDKNFHEEMQARSGMDLRQPAGLGPDRLPDNWLSGRLWYEHAYDMVAEGSKPAKSVMMFYRMGPQWLMKYSEGIQAEGILDIPARQAWKRAGEGWAEFGERQIQTSFGDTIYLRELARANEEYLNEKASFEEYCGQTYQDMLEQEMATLTSEQIAAWEKLDIDRTFNEVLMAEDVKKQLNFPPQSVVKKLPASQRLEATERANRLVAAKEKISHVEIYRNQINYAYWEARCIAEQEDAAILARTSMYEADQMLDKGELDGALEKYEIAWANWAELFNAHPAMMIDDAADAVLESIESYRKLLDQTELPDDFALRDFLEFRRRYDEQLTDPAMMGVISAWPARFPNRNFLTEMLLKTDALSADDAPAELPTINLQSPEVGQPPVPAPAASPTSEASEPLVQPAAESPPVATPENAATPEAGSEAESTSAPGAAASEGPPAESRKEAPSAVSTLEIAAPDQGQAPSPKLP
ncbi:hypothetical protein [Aureliella helgolandensis]|uniref:IRE (Iron responsive element) n=1 Tax=Aureliella helgolandensis TaxID=2527968 RepID=A0A518G5H7_9BACT|nr:hypothetical protein [Aureliella helgolandensis]QDV23819.1 hypothetical protein Q31a_21240 [Aureliella helgolandensis]